MKFRKKPVVVEAYQTDKEMIIHTLEGDHHASVGDWIITGVKGEQYPCKPDIFEQTYEPAEEATETYYYVYVYYISKGASTDDMIISGRCKDKNEAIEEWEKAVERTIHKTDYFKNVCIDRQMHVFSGYNANLREGKYIRIMEEPYPNLDTKPVS